MPGRAAAVGRHPRGLRRSTSSGSGGSSTPAGRSCRGPRRTAAATPALGVADLRGGVLPGRRRRSGSPRTASSCSPRRSSSSAPPEQQDRVLPRDGERRGPVVPGLVRARRRAATSPASRAGRSATTRPAAGGSTARRPGRPAARSAPTCSACSAPTPTAERHRGLTYFLVPARHRRASPCAASAGSTATRASPRCSSTTCSCPTTVVLGEVDEGWGVAMATTGSERGLTLRSPGRFLAAGAPPGRAWHRAPRRDGRPATCATRVAQAWIDAEAYRLQTLRDGHRHRRRAARPARESSLNKVFWSELDVRLHETALELLGADGRARRRRAG